MTRSDRHRRECRRCGQEFAAAPLDVPQYCDGCQQAIYRHRLRHGRVR